MEGCLANFSGRWKILLGKPEYMVNSQICHRFGKKTLVVLLYFEACICCSLIYPWYNFYFPLFFFMLIYDNEYKTKESKNGTKY